MTVEDEKRLVVLLALSELGGSGTKGEVVEYIKEKGYISFVSSDFFKKTAKGEPRWTNDLAFIKHHLKLREYIDGSQRNVWKITPWGRSLLYVLAREAIGVETPQKMTSQAIAAVNAVLKEQVDDD